MAMDLLKDLAASPLPAYFRAPEDIGKIRLLRAAGLVLAFVPADRSRADAAPSPEYAAQVFAITRKGCEALEDTSARVEDEAAQESSLTRHIVDAIQRARRTGRRTTTS